MANIAQILENGSQTLLVVSAADLAEFGLSIIERAKTIVQSEDTEDRRLTAREVREKYRVSNVTLWRWARNGFLVPSKVGNRNVYQESDVKRALSNDKA